MWEDGAGGGGGGGGCGGCGGRSRNEPLEGIAETDVGSRWRSRSVPAGSRSLGTFCEHRSCFDRLRADGLISPELGGQLLAGERNL